MATFLSLAREPRQKILYETFDMKELAHAYGKKPDSNLETTLDLLQRRLVVTQIEKWVCVLASSHQILGSDMRFVRAQWNPQFKDDLKEVFEDNLKKVFINEESPE